MTPERLQKIRRRTRVDAFILEGASRPAYRAHEDREALLDYTDELTAAIGKLGCVLKARDEEIASLRRGQGRAPAPATPGEGAYHETHPIPDSTGGTA